ncbi:hypothetical protein K443DRAFT_447840 [Laccaria amethystina LaAM-08-1]|uniref:Uncharacterized protein n=1 Tax=Laccaria amethystina LaAM-08-1 TaxID=1095629 RepID=A0A0C9Y5B8_9AGAR|nr:hypothetical protein K443DRAFT_447840 [Laccaria amethystina LaAM-08-1]
MRRSPYRFTMTLNCRPRTCPHRPIVLVYSISLPKSVPEEWLQLVLTVRGTTEFIWKAGRVPSSHAICPGVFHRRIPGPSCVVA